MNEPEQVGPGLGPQRINQLYALPEYKAALSQFYAGQAQDEMHESSKLLRDCSRLEKEQLADTLSGSKGEKTNPSKFEVSAIITMALSDALAGSYECFFEALRRQYDAILRQVEVTMMEHIGDVCSSTGQGVAVSSAEFTSESALEMIEKTHATFTSDGIPQLDSFAFKWIENGRAESLSLGQACLFFGPPFFRSLVEIIRHKREVFLAGRRVRRISSRTEE